jgi:hypothetical protein
MAQEIEHTHLPIRGLNLHVAQVGTGESSLLLEPMDPSGAGRVSIIHGLRPAGRTAGRLVPLVRVLQVNWARWCSCTASRRYGTRGATRCGPWPRRGTAPSRRTAAGTACRSSRRSTRRSLLTTSSPTCWASSTPSASRR